MITPAIRGYDKQGAGHYHAPRGKRLHDGVDFVCEHHEEIKSFTAGVVTKIGYPYDPGNIYKGHLRYVEVTDKIGFRCRYFYILPHVSIGDTAQAGDVLGASQRLTKIYPGITQHFHFEVMVKSSKLINPHEYFTING